MNEIVISGTGVFTPKESITNKELVEAYNSYAENFNNQNKDLINKGDLEALELSNEGADVIDLGAQSTRPNSYQIGSNEELKRLKPALKLIRKLNPDLLISIDTYHSNVAETALELGADWINDISAGRRDPSILNVVAEAKCPFVLTHSRGNSQSMDTLTSYDVDITLHVIQGLLRRTDAALKAGIASEKIISKLVVALY